MAQQRNKPFITKYSAPKIAIAVAFCLAVGKGAVGLFTGSIAVLSSALDSLLDILSSSFNYIMIKKADTPPDEEHQFGHGKLEAYASIVQSIVIFSTGAALLYFAYKKFRVPELPDVNAISIIVMAVAIAASLVVTSMLSRVAKRERSTALAADALHYTVDILSNGAVLFALLIIKLTGAMWIDPLIGAVIAVYIMYSAVKLHISALNILLDRCVSKDEQKAIEDAFHEFTPYLQDYHRLRTRTDGNRVFADVHVTLCRHLTLEEAHTFTEMIEDSMNDTLRRIDLVVHAEPCDGSCRNTDDCKKHAVYNLLRSTNAQR